MIVITTPATDEPVSLEMARLQCGISSDADGTSPDDPLLSIYISSAREWVESFLGLTVAPTGVEMQLDSFPAGDLTLESGPVTAVGAVQYLDTAGATQTVNASNYTLDTRTVPPRLRLVSGQAWPTVGATLPAVTVSYTVGYSLHGDVSQTAPLPKSIIAAILLVVAYRYRNREDVSPERMEAIPYGATALLYPLKDRLGFA